jgi:hypothetical protein
MPSRRHKTTCPIIPAERDAILDLIDRSKFSDFEWDEIVAFLTETVLPRIKPVPVHGRIVYFTNTDFHLDRSACMPGCFTLLPDGRLLCSHRSRARRLVAKCSLHKELHRIFCAKGDETVGGCHLRHTISYPPTAADVAAGTDGPTCKCSNWTHCASSVQLERAKPPPVVSDVVPDTRNITGDANGFTDTPNARVHTLRQECWERANNRYFLVKGERPCYSTVAERSTWSLDDPRWGRLHRWRRENNRGGRSRERKTLTYLQRVAREMSVCPRTINNYLRHQTFGGKALIPREDVYTFPYRDPFTATTDCIRGEVFAMKDSCVPARLLGMSRAASLARWFGTVHTNQTVTELVVEYVEQAIARTFAREPEPVAGSSVSEFKWVNRQNLQAVLRALKYRVVPRARTILVSWVDDTLKRDRASALARGVPQKRSRLTESYSRKYVAKNFC